MNRGVKAAQILVDERGRCTHGGLRLDAYATKPMVAIMSTCRGGALRDKHDEHV